jgi:hypothetical protein
MQMQCKKVRCFYAAIVQSLQCDANFDSFVASHFGFFAISCKLFASSLAFWCVTSETMTKRLEMCENDGELTKRGYSTWAVNSSCMVELNSVQGKLSNDEWHWRVLTRLVFGGEKEHLFPNA